MEAQSDVIRISGYLADEPASQSFVRPYITVFFMVMPSIFWFLFFLENKASIIEIAFILDIKRVMEV